MDYSFNVDIAIKYGVEKAVLIHNIAFWIKKNEANKKNYNNGYYWTYNSVNALTKLFPFWNEDKIQRLLKQLEDEKIIKTANYNKHKYDRTKWYTISAESILQKCGMETEEMRNASGKSAEPIPDSKPYKKHILNSYVKKSSNSASSALPIKESEDEPCPLPYTKDEHKKALGCV